MFAFVYGTLKKGFHNHDILSGATFVGDAHTDQSIYDMHRVISFPAVTEHGNGIVTGELYHIDEECLDDMDTLEGHPTLYHREEVCVVCDGTKYKAYMYIMDKSVLSTFNADKIEPVYGTYLWK